MTTGEVNATKKEGARRPAALGGAAIAAAAAIGVALFALRADGGVEGFRDADLEIAQSLRDEAMEGTQAYEIVRDLTTRVGPRMAGSGGDARGVEWAADVLESMEFDEVRLEPVSFPTWERGIESAAIASPAPQPLVITSLGYSPPTPEGGVSAEVVEFDDLDALRAADADQVEGRIAYIGNRMERAKDGSGYGPAVAARSQGPRIAHEKGAVALLIRSIGTGEHRFAHTGMIDVDLDALGPELADGDSEPSRALERAPSAALAHPDADQLERLLGSRGSGDGAGPAVSEDSAEPVEVELELGGRYGEAYTSQNVIAEIRGDGRPSEYVVISAHLDSWDLAPGALDDGAGVGIVIEAARRIAALDERPERTIRLVLFAAEEIGLVGAERYAEVHADELEAHHVGSESDFGAGEVYEFSARVTDEAWPLARAIGAELEPLGIEMGDQDAFGGPDMTPLRERGVPVADLSQDGTRYFDYHHTKDDTLDKIDPEALDQNVAAWLVFSWLAANAPIPFGPVER